MYKLIHDPITIARQFLFVREKSGEQNRGQRVEAIIRWSGGESGQPWCAYFATMVLDVSYHGFAPFARQGSSANMLTTARNSGWATKEPKAGDLFFYLKPNGAAHHVGFVTSYLDGLAIGIAGNTSADGMSVNGDGVYEHALSVKSIAFATYPKE